METIQLIGILITAVLITFIVALCRSVVRARDREDDKLAADIHKMMIGRTKQLERESKHQVWVIKNECRYCAQNLVRGKDNCSHCGAPIK